MLTINQPWLRLQIINKNMNLTSVGFPSWLMPQTHVYHPALVFNSVGNVVTGLLWRFCSHVTIDGHRTGSTISSPSSSSSSSTCCCTCDLELETTDEGIICRPPDVSAIAFRWQLISDLWKLPINSDRSIDGIIWNSVAIQRIFFLGGFLKHQHLISKLAPGHNHHHVN